ncbi:conserved hypothetical protein [Candidatus Sulfopaludibacter sp. SbA3]|nr:conserved hypothetical protein [Candidatus Sulfopaludibacter sp. SbA3]
MLTSVLIIALSLILFVYWFRYSCILLLRGATEQVVHRSTEQDPRFSFSDVQARLRTESILDPLHTSLNRDYQMLTYLLQHAAGLELASFEDRLLVLDYKVMQTYYRVTRTLFPEQSRKALTEMATVLEVLVRKMSQQAGI